MDIDLMNIRGMWIGLTILGGINLLTLLRRPKSDKRTYDSRSDSQ